MVEDTAVGSDPPQAPPYQAQRVRPGDTLAGRFLLRQVIGHGATGTVFAALDRSVGQKVAIKLLHPELDDTTTRERLRREVRAARAGHPNLVSVYDLHESNGFLFLSMELMEGQSLKDLMHGPHLLPAEQTVRIVSQVAAGLAHLHAQGIVHRDVKPGNIMIASDGTAKLCDMGLARPLDRGMTVTMTETVVGTPAYMAPEQGLGDELSAASDVYSLGVCLYQCLTADVPLNCDNAIATLTRRQRQRPPTVRRTRPDCPRWLARLVRQMLEPRPADRPSASRVARSLAAGRAWPRPRRSTLLAGAAAAAMALCAILIAPTVLHRDTVRFEVVGREIHGLDGAGRATWTYELPGPPSAGVLEARLDADERTDLVAAGTSQDESTADTSHRPRSFVVAVDNNGTKITRIVPEDFIGSWSFPYPVELTATPFALDLDADGIDELIVSCQHTAFYPTIVLAYWPRWDYWERVLVHPGHLTAFAVGPSDGLSGLRFAGVNNLLAFSPVFGEIELVPPKGRRDEGSRTHGLVAPPRGPLNANSVGSWQTYVPLDEARGGLIRQGDRLTVNQDGSVEIESERGGFHLDRYSNPNPGANEGSDLRAARIDFMAKLGRLHSPSSPITAIGVRQLIAKIRTVAGTLLEEPPYDIILAVVGARALASAGDISGSIQLIRAASERHSDEDLLFLESHLEAISGDLTMARATALRLIDTGTSSRSHYDGLFVLLSIGAQSHDRDLVARVVERAGHDSFRKQAQLSLQSALGARARLWWDETTRADLELTSSPLVPDGDALGCLVRWRAGQAREDEADRLRHAIETNPEASGLTWIALAAAHLARSQPKEALTALETAVAGLDPTARSNFIDHQDLELARAIRARALEALGDREAARREARRLADSTDPKLLPGILAREILARTGG